MIQKIKLKLLAWQIEWQWFWIMRFRRKSKKGKVFAPYACSRIKKREEKARLLKQTYENICGLTEILARANFNSSKL